MGFIFKGKDHAVSYPVLNWNEDHKIRIAPEDGTANRNSRINMIIYHTTEGKLNKIKEGFNPTSDLAMANIIYWSRSKKSAAAQLLIGSNLKVYQICDLEHVAYHIPKLNRVSIGIEIVQEKGFVYREQLVLAAKVGNDLCDILGIQKQVHLPYVGDVERIKNGQFFGVTGHRDGDNNRGKGDPDDFIFEELLKLGFEKFNVSKNEDIKVWKERQKNLGIKEDGIPGETTRKALENAGYNNGIWVNGKI